jgi:hypothetical protein
MYRCDNTAVDNIYFVGFVNPQIFTDIEGETMSAVGVNMFVQHSLSIIDQWETQTKL